MSAFHFIVNPLAGSGRTAECFAQVEKRLQELAVPYDKTFTTRAHQGTELTKAAIAAGATTIVAAGGDGTINEVAAGVYGSKVRLGILPFGTGNDFARCIGLPSDPMAALEILLRGKTRRLDGGMANDRFFINVAGLGFDVDVLRATDKYKVKYNGMLPYLLGIFDALFHLRTLHMRIEQDGRTLNEEALLAAVGNGQYIGGGMLAVPSADPFDGVFDIRIIKKVSVLRFLSLLPGFVKGKLKESCPYVLSFKADSIRIECSEACTLDLDGELLSSTPADFTLLRAAIELLCP